MIGCHTSYHLIIFTLLPTNLLPGSMIDAGIQNPYFPETNAHSQLQYIRIINNYLSD